MILIRCLFPTVPFLLLALAGCSSGDNPGDDPGSDSSRRGDGRSHAEVAATIGDKKVSESLVDAKLDELYRPSGGSARVFGPPDYPLCVAAKQDEAANSSATESDFRRECKVEYDLARAQAISDLVNAEWISREARSRGIDVGHDVRNALRRAKEIRRRTGEYAPIPEGYAASVRIATQRNKLLAAMPVTDQAIREYAAANADVYVDSESRRAQFLQTNTKNKAQRARRELERGVSWSAVQNRYSVKAWAAHDWIGIQTIDKDNAPADALGRSLFTAKRDTIIGPVRTLNGWFIFEVKAIIAPRHKGLTAEERQSIVIKLRGALLERTLHKRYGARTTCASRYQVPEAPQCQ